MYGLRVCLPYGVTFYSLDLGLAWIFIVADPHRPKARLGPSTNSNGMRLEKYSEESVVLFPQIDVAVGALHSTYANDQGGCRVRRYMTYDFLEMCKTEDRVVDLGRVFGYVGHG